MATVRQTARFDRTVLPVRLLSRRLGPLWPYLGCLVLALSLPAVLCADSLPVTSAQQHLLGLAMFALLVVASRYSPRDERRLVWLAVVCWTCVELCSSILWGLYRYRLGNVPLFVPPGHGVVYLFGLRASRTPLVQRHDRAVRAAVLVCAGVWSLAGLTVLPQWTGRVDVAGAVLWPLLAFCVWRSSAGSFYAAIFAVTAMLEVVGTARGVWAWAAVQPLTAIPSGNPLSAIAAMYCLIDLLLLRLWRARPRALIRQFARSSGEMRGVEPRGTTGQTATATRLRDGPDAGVVIAAS